MSFFRNVIDGIDKLGTETFDHQGKIDVNLHKDACFFLVDLDNFNGLLTPKNNFERIYGNGFVNLLYDAVNGLSLKKTNMNSIDNRVSSSFLNALKKSILVYLKIILDANWNECVDKKMRRGAFRNSGQTLKDPEIKCLESKFDGMGDIYCVLKQFKEGRKDIDISINGTIYKDIFLIGKEENITKFRMALNDEYVEIQNKLSEND